VDLIEVALLAVLARLLRVLDQLDHQALRIVRLADDDMHRQQVVMGALPAADRGVEARAGERVAADFLQRLDEAAGVGEPLQQVAALHRAARQVEQRLDGGVGELAGAVGTDHGDQRRQEIEARVRLVD